MASPELRIPRVAFEGVTAVLVGLALLAATGRGIISWREKKTVQLDDAFLIISCLFLICATGVLYAALDSVYELDSLVAIPPNIIELINTFQRDEVAYLILSWFAVFSVKYSFLIFFRRIVDRLPYMIRYWRAVMVFTTVVFAWSIATPFVSCSKFGLAAAACTAGPAAIRHILVVGSVTISLDIITDLMIVAIPVWVLWKVQMRTSQKLGLAVFLCLNVCLAIVAIIRVAGIHYRGSYDQIWGFFWQQMEACIAVILFSFTGFRSIFVSRRSTAGSPADGQEETPPVQAGTPRNQRYFKGLLPKIPSATMTGIRTFIRGEAHTLTINTLTEEEEMKEPCSHVRSHRSPSYGNSTNDEV